METQYKRPKLTAEEIRRLPNLLQVIKHFNKLTNDFVNSGGWSSVDDEPVPNDYCWHAPSMDFHNNIGFVFERSENMEQEVVLPQQSN
jgi:hypothetical protein